jgi:hypothetical protein
MPNRDSDHQSNSTPSQLGNMLSASGGALGGGTIAVTGVVVGAAEGTVGAAALTSGLASVGGIVGGGMFAGIIVVAAAPIACAALSWVIYRKRKAINDFVMRRYQ